MSNTLPVHNAQTLYPFFWVTAVIQNQEDDNPDKFYFTDAPTDDVATHFGVYRYDAPSHDGISYPTNICDCASRETADQVRAALDFLRDKTPGLVPFDPDTGRDNFAKARLLLHLARG